jgi:hypothetical protein
MSLAARHGCGPRGLLPSPRIASVLAIAIVATVLAAGCGPRSRRASGPPGGVRLVRHRYERALGSCAVGEPGCTWVRFRWPTAIGAPGRAAVDSINAWVRGQLLEPYESSDAPAATVTEWTARFFAKNHAFRRDFPDAASGGWYERREVERFGETLGVATFRYTHERFGGGAHPVTEVFYGCFDDRTGSRLRLDDLARPGASAALDSLGEVAFRRARAIPSARSLSDAAFTFAGDRFRLNDNVGLGPAGLVVEFNPYEVAPYAAGPTSLTLPWREVSGLLALPRRH